MSSHTAPGAHRSATVGPRRWTALGAASILAFAAVGFVSVLSDQEVMVREMGLLGFAMLSLVAGAALVTSTNGLSRSAAQLSVVLLGAASLMCSGPLFAWLDQLASPDFPGVLRRQVVLPGLVAMILGLIGTVGGAVQLRRSRPAASLR